MFDLRAAVTIPKRLERLGGCSLFTDWGRRVINIRAVNNSVLDLLYEKLKKVEDGFERSVSEITLHLLHVEEIQSFICKFIPVSKQSDRRSTTLFEKHSKWWNHGWDRLYSVRLLVFSSETRNHQNRKVSIHPILTDRYHSPREWNNWAYPDHSPNNDALPEEFNQPSSLKRTLKKEDMITQYHPEPNKPSKLGSRGHPFDTEATGTTARYFNAIVEGLPGSSDEPPTGLKGPPRVNATRRPKPRASSNSPQPGSCPSTAIPVSDPESLVVGGQSTTSVEKITDSMTTLDIGDTASRRNTRNTKDDMNNLTTQESQKGPVPYALGPRPAEKSKMNPWISKNNSRSNNSAQEDPFSELRHTMHQQMPPKSNNLRGNDHCAKLRKANLKELKSVFYPAFENSKAWYGNLIFEAKIGRLLYADVPKSILNLSIDWSEWNTVTKEAPLISAFSDAVTSDHHDAEFISDLKLSGGEPIFAPKAQSKSVHYEFIFAGNEKKILCLNAETFEHTLCDETQSFGTAYVPCPQFAWDFKICLAGRKPMNINLTPAFKTVLDSLAVIGGENPALTFLVNTECVVTNVRVYRSTRYPIEASQLHRGVPLELVMTEVQDLIIQRKDETFRAIPLKRKEMQAQNRIWYTFSIEATDINEKLDINRDLDGDSEWSIEDILGPDSIALSTMFDTVTKIISKINNVGYGNKQSQKFMDHVG
ncbi:hypothetical protein EDC01DRAFT_350961 [Geopyxis carbonaria]|nr:hypothetical protein EDC01DRAFT_350961 [Geopyxis carbonaria]